MKTTRVTALIALLAALVVLPALAEAGTKFERRISASADGVVEVENIHGVINVTGWSKNEVEVTGTLADWVEELEINSGDDEVSISVDPYDNDHWDDDYDEPTDLHIRVPMGSELRVEGVNGAIEVEGVTGPLELETVNGSIIVTGTPESVDAETVNGNISVSGTIPRVDAETVSGKISFEDIQGEANGECVSGRIEVRGGRLERGSFDAVSGDIYFDATVEGRDSFDFDTHSGNVTLVLSEDVDAEFDISTFSGDIENEFGPRAHRTDKYAPGMELSFTNGRGRSRISADSFSGTVSIRKRK